MTAILFWALCAGLVLALIGALSYPVLAAAKSGPAAMPRTRFAAIAAAGLIPIAAFALYFAVGSSALIGKKLEPAADFGAIAALPPEAQQQAIEGMVHRLETRLHEKPNDPDGWRRLARAYAVFGDAEKAAEAFDGLFKVTPGEAADWRAYMETLVVLGPDRQGGRDIAAVADRLIALNPSDPLALYFLGDRARRRGDFAAAADLWRRLLAVTPKDAPIRPQIEALLAEAENGAKAAALK